MWCAVAVPVLGLLGSLKAMFTAPLVTLDPVEQPPPTSAETAPRARRSDCEASTV